MNKLVTVLVGVACVVVIAAGALWIWRDYQASEARSEEQIAKGAQLIEVAQCGIHTDTLSRAAADPNTVTEKERAAATEGVIACRDKGIY